MHKQELHTHALKLRSRGYSIIEISNKLKIAKSTASAWCSNIELNKKALVRLEKRRLLGQYMKIKIYKKRQQLTEEERKKTVSKFLSSIKINTDLAKLCCALLFWCEGNKSTTIVRFTNSDPSLIALFLSLFRKGFSPDENKFRALIHLHEYHNDIIQKEFWSKITKIPITQFYKSYNKSNTKKRIHDNYQGCISVSYYDAKLAKELATIYNLFTHRGIV